MSPWFSLSPARRVGVACIALTLGTAVAGCGSATIGDLPPAAEPARAPEPTRAPAGEVRRIGGQPEGVIVDPQSHVAAVALRDPDRLRLIPLTRDAVGSVGAMRDVALPGAPRHLSIRSTEATTQALVPAETGRRAVVVDLPSGDVRATIPTGDHPHDLAPITGGRLAIGDERANTMTIADATTGAVERTVPVATQPGGLASLRDGTLLLVVSVRERVVELFDARTLERRDRIPVGVGPTHVVCSPDGPCFVTDTEGDALLVVRVAADGRSLRLSRRVYLDGAPYGIAIDPDRTRLWVTLTARNELVELPAHGRPHVLARRPTVQQADTVAVDTSNGDVVVTGRTHGELQLLRNPASGAHTSRGHASPASVAP